MRQRRELDQGWELLLGPTARERLGTGRARIPATVPGCVHTDLMAAGLLPDPRLDLHELDQFWIGETDWTYRLALDEEAAADGEHVDLVCDGLDTLATVSCNGAVVATTANQHRRYRIPLTGTLVDGGNVVEIAFAAPAPAAARRRDEWGDLPNPYGRPYNFIRKMACNFGWDWGPTVTTAGIWRPIGLERWRRARLGPVRPTATVGRGRPLPGEAGALTVVVEVQPVPGPEPAGPGGAAGLELDLVVLAPDGSTAAGLRQPVDGPATELTVPVAGVERWWPIGQGQQPRYTVDVSLSEDGRLLDRRTTAVGFRSVELDTTPDPEDGGRAFRFVINGQRLWVRGFNWIPDNCFPSAVTPLRLRAGIDEAAAANANLLRVWGGGLYEDDAFYHHCDEIGMLVWQDFAFACAAYPEAELRDEITAEAADNVERLMSHPSLIVWNGNNECLEGWDDWGWRDLVGDRPWGDAIYRSWLPEITGRLDPGRPYLDGSPTSLDADLRSQRPDRGTVHLWDVWNDLHYEHYRDHTPRFVAEFGFQAPATHATLRAAIDLLTPLAEDEPAMVHRQRAFEGREKLSRWLGDSFGPVSAPDDWLYLTQLNQARAVELGIGHFRSLHEWCSGVIWWQLNDCWPAISWSVVDSGGRRKPAWYAARRAMADRAIVVRPHADGLEVVAVNDSGAAWRAEVSAAVWAGAGDMGTAQGAVRIELGPVVVPAGGTWSKVLTTVGGRPVRPNRSLVVITASTVGEGGHEESGRGPVAPAVRSVAAPPGLPRLRPRFTTTVSPIGDGVEVTVSASTVVRDLCLLVDRVDPEAEVDDMVVTLLPGERRRFTVRTTVGPERWTAALGQPDPVVIRALDDRL